MYLQPLWLHSCILGHRPGWACPPALLSSPEGKNAHISSTPVFHLLINDRSFFISEETTACALFALSLNVDTIVKSFSCFGVLTGTIAVTSMISIPPITQFRQHLKHNLHILFIFYAFFLQ